MSEQRSDTPATGREGIARHDYRQFDGDDEIDLLELWRTLLKYKRMILKSVLGAAFAAAAISLLMTNIYRGEVLLTPAQSEDAKSSGLASALGGLGGLASLAGVSLGGGGSTEENLAVLSSRGFLWKFVQEKKLMPILFEDDWDADKKRWKEDAPEDQPGQWDMYRLLIEGKNLDVIKDKETSIITVAFEWKDPALAAEWANALVASLNQYLAQQTVARSERNLQYLNEELMKTQVEEMRKTLFDLIASEQKNAMLASAQKEFAFRVLDHAVAPDKKVRPKRTIIVLLSTFVAGFLAVIVAFIKEALARRREEEGATETVEAHPPRHCEEA